MFANNPERGQNGNRQPDEVTGCLEVSAQALTLLERLTSQQYTHIASPLLQSSIGSHMRHILDVCHALAVWPQSSMVDYDNRRRAHPVESQRDIAIDEWHRIRAWLGALTASQMETPVTVKSEVCLSRQVHREMPSTLGRELAFISSHAVHHMALIRVSLCAQGVEYENTFGVAPTTLSHQRGE